MKVTLIPFIPAALAIAACANARTGEDASAHAPSEPTTSDAYLDAPQSPGTWTYVEEPGETLALFGEAEQMEGFLMRCGDGAVSLAVMTGEPQEEARAMQVTTETVTAQLVAAPVPSRKRILAADLAPGDPLLDAMAITKGRFAIEVEGLQPLYLPAWAEVTRVIEDCR